MTAADTQLPLFSNEIHFRWFKMIWKLFGLCIVGFFFTLAVGIIYEHYATDNSCGKDKYFCECSIYEYDYSGIVENQQKYFDFLENYERVTEINANGIISCGKSKRYNVMYPIYVSRVIHPDHRGETRYALVAQDSIQYYSQRYGNMCAKRGIKSASFFKDANNTNPIVLNSDSCQQLWDLSHPWEDILSIDPVIHKKITIIENNSGKNKSTECSYINFVSQNQIEKDCNDVYTVKTQYLIYWKIATACFLWSGMFLLIFIPIFLCKFANNV